MQRALRRSTHQASSVRSDGKPQAPHIVLRRIARACCCTIIRRIYFDDEASQWPPIPYWRWCRPIAAPR